MSTIPRQHRHESNRAAAVVGRVICGLLLALVCPALVAAQPIEGFSRPFRIAELAASSSGILEEWRVDEGEQVTKGQPLLDLEAKVTEATLSIARAALEANGETAAAEAEFKLHQERLTALRGLENRGHATGDELRRAEAESALAAAHLQSAAEKRELRRLECAKLEAELASYRITAPFDGVVIKFHKTIGEYVGPGDVTVCTLAELTTLSVEFLIPRGVARRFRVGSAVSANFLESEARAAGEVCYISPLPEGETGMFTLRVRIENRDRRLSAGERCVLVLGAAPDSFQEARLKRRDAAMMRRDSR